MSIMLNVKNLSAVNRLLNFAVFKQLCLPAKK